MDGIWMVTHPLSRREPFTGLPVSLKGGNVPKRDKGQDDPERPASFANFGGPGRFTHASFRDFVGILTDAICWTLETP